MLITNKFICYLSVLFNYRNICSFMNINIYYEGHYLPVYAYGRSGGSYSFDNKETHMIDSIISHYRINGCTSIETEQDKKDVEEMFVFFNMYLDTKIYNMFTNTTNDTKNLYMANYLPNFIEALYSSYQPNKDKCSHLFREKRESIVKKLTYKNAIDSYKKVKMYGEMLKDRRDASIKKYAEICDRVVRNMS